MLSSIESLRVLVRRTQNRSSLSRCQYSKDLSLKNLRAMPYTSGSKGLAADIAYVQTRAKRPPNKSYSKSCRNHLGYRLYCLSRSGYRK